MLLFLDVGGWRRLDGRSEVGAQLEEVGGGLLLFGVGRCLCHWLLVAVRARLSFGFGFIVICSCLFCIRRVLLLIPSCEIVLKIQISF